MVSPDRWWEFVGRGEVIKRLWWQGLKSIRQMGGREKRNQQRKPGWKISKREIGGKQVPGSVRHDILIRDMAFPEQVMISWMSVSG